MGMWRCDKGIKFASDYGKAKLRQSEKIVTCHRSAVGKEPISPWVVCALSQLLEIPWNRKHQPNARPITAGSKMPFKVIIGRCASKHVRGKCPSRQSRHIYRANIIRNDINSIDVNSI